jgi:hypothetical protein
MKVELNDPALARLYSEAKRRGLRVMDEGGSIYKVSSFSCHGLWHKVTIEPDGLTCTCASTSACTHRAIALAEHSLIHWRHFEEAESERFMQKRAQAQMKAWAKVVERRKRQLIAA